MVIPSHYNGIPIVGTGYIYAQNTGSFLGTNSYDDFCINVDEIKIYNKDLMEDNSISTIYFAQHHNVSIKNFNYIDFSKLEKLVYISNITRENLNLPNCKHEYGYDFSYWDCYVSDLIDILPIPYDDNGEVKVDFSHDFKIVVTKNYKQHVLKELQFFKDKKNQSERYNHSMYMECIKLLENIMVLPNIYFYNNYSETDKTLYWIDYIENGEKVFTPFNPYNGSKTFLGWYTEKECINKWDFSKNIELEENQVLKLYAKWS